jgi:cation diffusion facilitator CzcD-associated flavoprotein CzcO
VETGSILKFTPTGIEMEDGTSHAFDAVICATGFDTSFRPSFPVIGDEGTDLRDVWAKEPRSYLSIAASGFPNFFSKSASSSLVRMS